MKLSDGIVKLIQNWEGCRLTAYRATPNEPHFTIGYGHYGPDVIPGSTITQERANELFLLDSVKMMDYVANVLEHDTPQHEFDALVSLCYNIGIGNLMKSDVLKYHNLGEKGMCAYNFSDHVYAHGGVFYKGLMLRRMIEACWYLTGKDLREM